jgi:membrane protein YdbS with pleckstrin-like domain
MNEDNLIFRVVVSTATLTLNEPFLEREPTMKASQKNLPKLLYTVEIIIFLVIGYSVRSLFDRLTVGFNPQWLVFALKILILFGLIALAVFVHTQMERWMRSKGWIK